LVDIHRRLDEVRVTYPVPIRVSLEKTLDVVREFIAGQSGGDRVQAVACALFHLIGARFGLYRHVRRATINAADAATGLVADLECVSEEGRIVLAVEVKDKELTLGQIQAKLQGARAKRVAEVLFVAQKGIAATDQERFPAEVEGEFAAGHNVYVFELGELAKVALALMGESARPKLLELVGQQLEEFHSDIRHRWVWRDLLAALRARRLWDAAPTAYF
jgi:hypothetical protein